MLAYAFVYFHKLLIYSVLYYSRSYYAMYSLKRDHTFYNVLVSNCLHSHLLRTGTKKPARLGTCGQTSLCQIGAFASA
jgi:hypothetical protein